MSRSIVPPYLTLKDTAQRTDAWLLWRLGFEPDGLAEKDLIRDGAYDVFRLQSNSESTRQSLFKKAFRVRVIHLTDRGLIRQQGDRFFATHRNPHP